jgi:toluene monooxygenase system protein A
MTLLNRDDWYDISHDLDWTLSYVEEQEAFPVEWSGTQGVPKEAWQSWEDCSAAGAGWRHSHHH